MSVSHSAPRASFVAPTPHYSAGNERQFRRDLEQALVDITAYVNRVIVDPASVATHASTHASGGSDPVSLAATQITSGTIASARISGSYTGITGVGTITAGTWQGTSISTTYTDAKLKTLTGTTNRVTVGGTATDPTVDISTSYVGQNTITTLGTITTGVWNGSSISTTYTDAKVVSVVGTSNRITSSGGANPAIDISGSYVGQSSITTLGTIGTGVWQGTAVADSFIASASTWNAKIGGSGTANYHAKFTASGTIGDSQIRDDGTTLAIGTAPSGRIAFNMIQSASSSGGLAAGIVYATTLTMSANSDTGYGLLAQPTINVNSKTGTVLACLATNGGAITGGTPSVIYGLFVGDVTLATTNYAIYTGAGTVRFGDIVQYAGTNSTGSGSALLGSNSPASTLTAPYTWITAKSSDGSTVYIPCWK